MKVQFTFLVVFCFFSFNIKAEKIPLSSYYIPGLVDSPETGVMIDMLRKIESFSGIDFDVSLMPTQRVQQSFSHQKISAYFPELEEFRPPNSCRTRAFMQKPIIAITRIDNQLVTDLSQLNGRKVGAVSGYSYGSNITKNPNFTIVRVNNDEANIKKLLSGRIDAIVGDTHSTVNALKSANLLDKVRLDLKYQINVLDVFFIFKTDKQGLKHCKKVSQAIEQLRADGDLLRWFNYQ